MNSFLDFKVRLDKFINKYYKIQLLKGLLYVFILLASSVTLFSLLEYFGWYSSSIRLLFLSILCFGILGIVGSFIVIPLFRFFNIFNKITYKDAGRLISTIFDDVDDSILNILELNESNNKIVNNDLIQASIHQKIKILDKFNFLSGISYKGLNFLLPYFLGVTVLIIFFLFIQPKVYTEGTKRIIQYNNYFEKDYGFKIILPDTLVATRNKDYILIIPFVGTDIPESLFIKFDVSKNICQKVNDSTFSFNFKNINNSFQFYFTSDDYQSKSYLINIIDQPTIKNFDVFFNYPPYLQKKQDVFSNIYDFSVPQGTDIKFVMDASYVDKAAIYFDSTRYDFVKIDSKFTFSYQITKNTNYSVQLINDSFNYNFLQNKSISIIPDFFPSIGISYIIDELNFNIYHFRIIISDDHGFSQLKYIIEEEEIPLLINKNLDKQECYFSYDFSNVSDSIVKSYFSVYDNDSFSGFKHTNSNQIFFKKLSNLDIISKNRNATKDLEEKMNKSLSLAKELQKDIDKLQKDLLTDKLDKWEKKKRIDNILDKQKELESILNNVAKQNKENDIRNNSNSSENEEILKKQKLLQESLENLMTDEFKELLKQLEELQKDFNSEQLNQMAKDMNLNMEELNKELDRNLEQIKKYQIENQIDKTISELRNLENSQKNMAKELLKKSIVNNDSLTNSTLNDQFDFKELMENYSQLQEENDALTNPLELDDFSEEIDEINDSFDDVDSSDTNEKNGEQLEELADKMEAMMSSNSSKEEGENADAIRLLLDNLFYFSFAQENLLNDIRTISVSNPKYIVINLKQLQLSDDFTIINDSLNALSLRALEISTEISNSTTNINQELANSLLFYENRKISSITKSNQLTIQYTNDMILILSESLKNMQNSGGGGGSGSKKKQKPKKGEPSLGDMRKSQEDMLSDMKKMLEDMKNGNQPGQGMSQKQMGQMLAKQEIFQKMLQDLANSGKNGSEVSKQLNEIKKLMEYNKRDLINMQLNDQTYFRQQQILTRLLEAENSELEREKDDKRKSTEAKSLEPSKAKKYFEQYDEKTNFKEIILFDEISLEPFYKTLFINYLENINSK